MPEAPQTPDGAHPIFDWIDVLLGFATLCAGFGVATALGFSDSSRLFKIGLAAALLVVIGIRRVAFGPPRASAIGKEKSALGLIGAACMLFGLVIVTGGASFLFEEWNTPISDPPATDYDAIERQIGLPAFGPPCTRDGKVMRGRACMTAEQRAKEVAEDDQRRAEERTQLSAEKRHRLSKQGSVAGVGVALVLVGIALDILRSRRGAVKPSAT